MSDEPLDACYAFTGDAQRVHRKTQALRRHFGRSEAIRLGEASAQQAVDACRELGFESNRVVIVDARAWDKVDVSTACLYLMDPTPGTVLALWLKEIPRELRVRSFNLPGEKKEVLIWPWIDAWGERRQARTLDLLARQLAQGDDAFGLLGVITGHIKTVLMVKDYANRGYDATDIQEATGKHPFTIQKAYRHGLRRSHHQLAGYLSVLAECDLAMKGGSRTPIEFELTRAVAKLF